ncbi:MAG: hypothetical protein KatS3mg002_0075 [Candidatus Woesearchaeota archaeon]|nr:MAG: hypothetical protein KatS3mg002_0075 [Candidatus Woesearchaeota archaeon]
MNHFRLYEKDLKIIAELEKDSRTSISQIAKNCGIIKEVANYRIKRMQEEGFIEGYKAIIDYYALGYNQYALLINLHRLEETTKTDIIKEFRSIEKIEVMPFIQGTTDIRITFWVKNQKELLEKYDVLMNKYGKYIKEKNFTIIYKNTFLSKKYIHKITQETTIGISKNKEISSDEEKILLLIEKNPLEGTLEISKKLNIPASTVTTKIKRLIAEKILLKATPILNTSLLGYSKYNVDIKISDSNNKKYIIEQLKSEINVTKIEENIGDYELSFNAEVKTAKELDMIMNRLRIKYPNIEDFEVKIIE